MAFTADQEGGALDLTPGDPGNWTGGAVGKGSLRGSRFGISSAVYPHLDMRTLTLAQAQRIYRNDFWIPIAGDALPPSIALVAFDSAVHHGWDRATRWLQAAVGLRATGGRVGPETLRALGSAIEREGSAAIAARVYAARESFLRRSPAWRRFGGGWARRLCALRQQLGAAAAMARMFRELASQPVAQAGRAWRRYAFSPGSGRRRWRRLPVCFRSARMTAIASCFAVIVGHEGGFAVTPSDRGDWTGGQCGVGECLGTNWGVSTASYRDNLARLPPELRATMPDTVRELTQDMAIQLFYHGYWKPLRCDDMPAALALILSDSAYNNGIGAAARLLQAAVGAKEDGAIGPATLAAVAQAWQQHGGAHVLSEFMARRMVLMASLPTWRVFGLGWARRLAALPYEAVNLGAAK